MSNTNDTTTRAVNQYAEARKALQSIGNSKSHKNQVLSSSSKYSGASQELDLVIFKMFNKAAEEGNFAKLISLLASQKTDEQRQCLMNEARRRQSDAALSNQAGDVSTKKAAVPFWNKSTNARTKGKDWYDLTPLAAAALHGRANVVEYLLRQGADPTLRGSPADNKDYNALEAAKEGVKTSQKDIDWILSGGNDEISDYTKLKNLLGVNGQEETPESALATAQILVQKRDQCLLCLELLEAVVRYWPRAQTYSSHYRKRNYNNKPCDIKALRAALDAITLEASPKSMNSTALLNDPLVSRLAAKIAAPCQAAACDEESHSLSKNNTEPMKVKNRRKRYSDSFCIPPPRDLLHDGTRCSFNTSGCE